MDSGKEKAAKSNITEAPRPAYSRKDVVNALRYGVSRFQTFVDSNAPQVNDRDRWFLNKAIKPAMSGSIDRTDASGNPDPVDNLSNEFKDEKTGEVYTQQEGIPVDRLIDFLDGQLATTRNQEEADKIQKTLTTLKDNSQDYSQRHKTNPDDPESPDLNMNDAENKLLEARKAQEANYVRRDERAANRNPDDEKLNWFEAVDTLKTRRELVLPPATKKDAVRAVAAAPSAGGTPVVTEPVAEVTVEPARTPDQILNEADSAKGRELAVSAREGDSFTVRVNPDVPDQLQFLPGQANTENAGSVSVLVSPDGTDGNTIYIQTKRQGENGESADSGTSLHADELEEELVEGPYRVRLTPDVAVEITSYDPVTGQMTIRREIPEAPEDNSPSAQLAREIDRLAEARFASNQRQGVEGTLDDVKAILQRDLDAELDGYMAANPDLTRDQAMEQALNIREAHAQNQQTQMEGARQILDDANSQIDALNRSITPDMDDAAVAAIEAQIAQISSEAQQQIDERFLAIVLPGLAEAAGISEEEYNAYLDQLSEESDTPRADLARDIVQDAINLGIGLSGDIGRDPRLVMTGLLDQTRLDELAPTWDRIAPILADLRLMTPEQFNGFVDREAARLGVPPEHLRFLLMVSASEARVGLGPDELPIPISTLDIAALSPDDEEEAPAPAATLTPALPGTPILPAPTPASAGSSPATTTTPASSTAPGVTSGGTTTTPPASPALGPATTNLASTQPASGNQPGVTPDNAPINPDGSIKDISVDVVNAETPASQFAHREATKDVTESMRKHAWYKFWRWPQKAGLRLSESGIVNIRKDRLLKAMSENNSTLLDMKDINRPANELAVARAQGQQQLDAILERFRKNGTKTGETALTQVDQAGVFGTALKEQVLHKVVSGELTDQSQVRAALAEIVRANIKDAEVQKFFGANVNEFGDRAEIFASSVLEAGQRMKDLVDNHNKTLEQVDEKLVIRLGIAGRAINTDTRGWVDKRIAWLKQKNQAKLAINATGRGGWVFNPLVAGVVMSVATEGALKSFTTLTKASRVVPAFWAGALAGGAVAGIRRYHEIGRDRANFAAGRAISEQVPGQQHSGNKLGRAMERIGGKYRLEDMQKHEYQAVSTSQLEKGDSLVARGQQPKPEQVDIVTQSGRRSVDTLLSLDLNDQLDGEKNRNELASRIAEIETRLDLSGSLEADFIQFGSKLETATKPLELLALAARLRVCLNTSNLTPAERNTLVAQQADKWQTHLREDKSTKDSSFLVYRLRNAAGAAAFGVVSGAAGVLVGQEIIAGARRLAGEMVGPTILENIANPLLEKVGHTKFGVTGVDQTAIKDLFDHPRNLPVSKDIVLRADFNHNASLVDGSNNPIDTPPLRITEHGIVMPVEKGTLNPLVKLSTTIKDAIASWEKVPVKGPENVNEHLKALVASGKHETFTQGNMIIDVNTNLDAAANPGGIVEPGVNRFSMTLFQGTNPDGSVAGIRVDGFLDKDPSGNPLLNLDSSIGDNAKVLADSVKMTAMQTELLHSGWKINVTGLPGRTETINTINDFFAKSPEQMRALGVIDISKMAHDPQYDTLRPDIVARTGNYTHNELTFHVAKFRNWPGSPGHLTATGQIQGGIIPSHLEGVAPQADPALDQINRLLGNTAGKRLEWKDMVYIVRTSNGGEIILPMQPDSGADLPQEFFKTMPDGSVTYRGIGRMGYGVLQSSVNGPVIPADTLSSADILANKGKFVTRWLASEEFGGKDATDIREIPGTQVVNMEPPEAFEFRPPTAVIPELIPFPFAPRHPLSEMERRSDLGYYYLGEPSPEERQRYEERRSPRLRANPEARLDPTQEVRWYLDQQSPEYRRELEQMNNAIGEPMSNECRAAIVIPVASHQEGANIYNTLMQYTNQRGDGRAPVNPNAFEVVLFLNRPEASSPDATAREVSRFRAEHPEVKVRVVEKIFPVRPNMGVISKYVADIALLRGLERSNPVQKDLILVTNDADADMISKRYIDAIISQYDNPANDRLEGALGKIEWNPESYIKYPGFHVANRFYQFIEAQRRHGRGGARNVGSSGANFTLKSSIYASVGGYDQGTDLAQDVQLGRMIRSARNNDPKAIDYNNGAWIVTNPRRGVLAYTQGIPVVNQWNDWSSQQGDVRVQDWRSNPVTSETVDSLDINHLQNDINASLSVYGVAADESVAQRALNLLGLLSKTECQARIDKLENQGSLPSSSETQALIKSLGLRNGDYHIEGGKVVVDNGGYKIEDGKIVLVNISRLQENLRLYRDTNRDKINELKNELITGNAAAPLVTPRASSLAATVTAPLRTVGGVMGAAGSALASTAASASRAGSGVIGGTFSAIGARASASAPAPVRAIAGAVASRGRAVASAARSVAPANPFRARASIAPTTVLESTVITPDAAIGTPVEVVNDPDVAREGGLVQSINERLSAATTDTVRLEYSPKVVSEYLGSLDLGSGAGLSNITSGPVVDGKFTTTGIIEVPGRGRLPFNFTFENDEINGQLRVAPGFSVDYSDIPNLIARNVIKGRVNNAVGNLNQLVLNRLGNEIDNSTEWGIGGLSIDGENLAIDVNRKNVAPPPIVAPASPPAAPTNSPDTTSRLSRLRSALRPAAATTSTPAPIAPTTTSIRPSRVSPRPAASPLTDLVSAAQGAARRTAQAARSAASNVDTQTLRSSVDRVGNAVSGGADRVRQAAGNISIQPAQEFLGSVAEAARVGFNKGRNSLRPSTIPPATPIAPAPASRIFNLQPIPAESPTDPQASPSTPDRSGLPDSSSVPEATARRAAEVSNLISDWRTIDRSNPDPTRVNEVESRFDDVLNFTDTDNDQERLDKTDRMVADLTANGMTEDEAMQETSAANIRAIARLEGVSVDEVLERVRARINASRAAAT